MYSRPKLERFGSLRALTRLGFDSASDGINFFGISSPGCETDGQAVSCPPDAERS